jgi:hypothetical protein
MSGYSKPTVGQRWQWIGERPRQDDLVVIKSVAALDTDVAGSRGQTVAAGTQVVTVEGELGLWWDTVDQFVEEWSATSAPPAPGTPGG